MVSDNDIPIALNRIVNGDADILQLILCKEGRITTLVLDDNRVEWLYEYLRKYRREKGKNDATE